jgi:hypothetical protein
MSELPDNFAQRLIRTDTVNPAAVESLQREIDSLVERKLSRTGRWTFAVMGFVWLAGAGWMALLMMRRIAPPASPLSPSVSTLLVGVLVVSIVMFVMLACLSFWTAYSATVRRQSYAMWSMASSMIAMGAVGVLFVRAGMVNANHDFTFFGMVMLALLGGAVLGNQLQSLHARLRQKLLEIDLHVTQVAERLERIERRFELNK